MVMKMMSENKINNEAQPVGASPASGQEKRVQGLNELEVFMSELNTELANHKLKRKEVRRRISKKVIELNRQGCNLKNDDINKIIAKNKNVLKYGGWW